MTPAWSEAAIPDLTGIMAVVTRGQRPHRPAGRVAWPASAQVVLGVRLTGRGQAAATAIRRARPGAPVEVMALDLADLASVHRFAESPVIALRRARPAGQQRRSGTACSGVSCPADYSAILSGRPPMVNPGRLALDDGPLASCRLVLQPWGAPGRRAHSRSNAGERCLAWRSGGYGGCDANTTSWQNVGNGARDEPGSGWLTMRDVLAAVGLGAASGVLGVLAYRFRWAWLGWLTLARWPPPCTCTRRCWPAWPGACAGCCWPPATVRRRARRSTAAPRP